MSHPAYDTINFSVLQQNVTKAARQIIEACQKACGDESLYGFAFCPDEDVHSMLWMANTEEGLTKFATSLHKQAAKHGSDQTLEEIAEILRFGCVEWTYGEEAIRIDVPFDSDLGLGEIWDEFRSAGLTGAKYDTGFADVRTRALEAIAGGLRDLRKSGAVDEDFLLLVQFPDSGDIPELLRLAKLTNSKAQYNRYKAVCELE